MRLEPIIGTGENTGEIMGYREIPEPGDSLATQLTNFTPATPQVGSDNWGNIEQITRPFYADGAVGTGQYDPYSGVLTGAYVDRDGTRTFYNASGQPTNSVSLKSSGFFQDLAPAVMDLLPAILPVLPAPLALAYNVANAIQSGDPLAILASAVNVPGISDVVGSEVSSAVSNANKINSAVKAIESGNLDQLLLSTALSSGVNEAKANAVDEYLNSIEPGTSYSADLPTEVDVLSAMGISPDVNISDYPVQDFGIDLGTIDTNTDFYTSPDATAYFQNPDNTSTYTWDDGSSLTIDAAGEITGYQPSFDIASAGATESATKDISGKLAALDIGKTLSMAALASILANTKASGGDGSGKTFFEMVPIPADWKSPEYNMAFTPSAPINFGSPELLKGTQWDRPVNLSGLINTLNQPVIAPETQRMMTQFQAPSAPYQMGVNDIIGNLGGKPVSISDIISGIQSGQTYPSTMG